MPTSSIYMDDCQTKMNYSQLDMVKILYNKACCSSNLDPHFGRPTVEAFSPGGVLGPMNTYIHVHMITMIKFLCPQERMRLPQIIKNQMQ